MTPRRLVVLLAAELLLARATSGPLPMQDVVIATLAAALCGALAARWQRLADAVAAIVLAATALPPALDAGPVSLWALPALALLWPLRPSVRPVAALVGVAAVVAPSPAVLGWAFAVAGLTRWPQAAVLAPVVALAPTPNLRPADSQHDVLLITVDALRADVAADLPAFRRPGCRPYDAWTNAPWTLPALASLHTGTLPTTHGAGRTQAGFVGPDTALPTVAERAAQRGFRTTAISDNNPFTGTTFGLLRGFQETHHPLTPSEAPLPRGRSPHAYARPLAARLARTPHPLPDAADVLHRPGPDFVWRHLMGLHLPYPSCDGRPISRQDLLADPSWSTPDGIACLRTAYEAAARRVDAELTDLLDRVPSGTLVILTADHGEALGDAGVEHGHTADVPVSRIPLVVCADWPAVNTPVDLTDLGATLLALFDAPRSGPGRDLRAPLLPRPIPIGPALYTHATGELRDGWLTLDAGDGSAPSRVPAPPAPW